MRAHELTADELLTALNEAFENGDFFPLEVTGWSMRPLLTHGRDTVWLRPFVRADCKRGRILLYQRDNGRLVLHRVRECLKHGYLMNGDAQSACEFILDTQVAAEVFKICRRGRMMDCASLRLRLWDMIWYPTRPVRALIFKAGHRIKRVIHRA